MDNYTKEERKQNYRKTHYISKRKSVGQRFLNMIDILQDEPFSWIFKGYKTKDGYGLFSYYGKTQPAHRVSYLMFTGKVPKGMDVMHTEECVANCNDRSCCSPWHLTLGTRKENIQQSIKEGRFDVGHRRKLTFKQAEEIRKTKKRIVPAHKLAKKYKVNKLVIDRIRKGETYFNYKRGE